MKKSPLGSPWKWIGFLRAEGPWLHTKALLLENVPEADGNAILNASTLADQQTSPGRMNFTGITWNPLLSSEVTIKYEFLMVATAVSSAVLKIGF